jgi:hypothetical protein
MVRTVALIGLTIAGIVAASASAGASGDGVRLGLAHSLSTHPAHRSACERRARRHRNRCRGARHQPRAIGYVAPSQSVAPASQPTPDPRPGNDSAPKFGGLQSAFACTPGPQRPGQTTPFNLSWEAAVDDVTPPALIVYEVYLATTPGGEDFAHPTWTTDPGATSFRTPGLASHGSFYFVVRARDTAGNEDTNLVERHGVDPCV